MSKTHDCSSAPGTVALEITALSHGPDAVALHEGRVVFVPGVAPGDRVHARLLEERATFARAEVVDECVRGGAHRDPPCAWVGTCGGCPWQQVVYPAQLAAKAANVREALARIGGVTAARELPIVAAPDEWRYRHRIRVHVGARGALGFRRPRSHRLVEIGDCVIADAALAAALGTLRPVTPRLRTRLRTIELLTNGRGAVVAGAVATGAFVGDDEDILATLVRGAGGLAGIEVRSHDWRRQWGDVRIIVSPDEGGPAIVQQPGTFTQVNTAANRLLVDVVRRMAAPARRILDLFCGAGNLSLPLARAGAAVVGVDANADAIADARGSAAEAGLAARFEALPALRFLTQQGLAGAELVLLDPPRTGAAAEVAQLARLRPPRLLYVSCDPATLARDAATLARAGYRVDRVQPLDLFPQTPHVETVLESVVAID